MFKNGLILTLFVFLLLSEECLGTGRELLRNDSATLHGIIRSVSGRNTRRSGRYQRDIPLTAKPEIELNSSRRQFRNDLWDNLGFGVHPYDSLFDHSKLHGRVLDLGTFPPSSPVRSEVHLRQLDNLRADTIVESGFDAFARRIMETLESNMAIGSFRVSISSHYNFETTQRDDFFFSRTALFMERAHIRVKSATISRLRSLVLPNVAQDLETLTPREIFDVYGTHVTTGLVVGGELEMWFSAANSRFESKEEFSESVSASFKKRVEGSASLTSQEVRLSSRTQTVEGLILRGGHLRQGPNARDDWIASTLTNAQEIGYLRNGAVPIWSLIPNLEQAKRVQKSYRKTFGPKGIILKRFSSRPLDEVSTTTHPKAQVYVPNGWKVVSGGVNLVYDDEGQLLTASAPIVENGRAVGWRAEGKYHVEHDVGKMIVFAIAIWDPYDSCDIVVHTATSEEAQHPAVEVTLPPEYTRVGGGAATLGSSEGSFLVATYPKSKRTWSVSSKDHHLPSPSRVEAYVIGLKFNVGGSPRARVRSATDGPSRHTFTRVKASTGYSIIGGGAQVSKGGYGHMLVCLVPGPEGQSFEGYGQDLIHEDEQVLTVYAIEIPGAVFVKNIDDVMGIDPTD